MREKEYKGFYDLADDMFLFAEDGKYVVATLFYEDAAELLKALMCIPYVEIQDINLEMPRSNFYTKEYYISLTPYHELACEPAMLDGRYLNTECDIMLIDGDANSAIIRDLDDSMCYEISIWDFDDYDDECACCDEPKIHFSLDDDVMSDIEREPEVYGSLLELITDAILATDFEFTDDGEIESAYVDIREIFKALRNS